MLQWSYYTYWSGLPVDGFEISIRPDRGWAAVPTNDGLTLLVVGWPYAESTAYKADVEANYLKTLELAPEFAERVRGATREERFAGGVRAQLLPQAVRARLGARRRRRLHQGPDHRPGDQRRVPRRRAVRRPRSTRRSPARARSTTRWPTTSATRDAHVLPIYEFTTQLATLEPPPPEMQQLLGAVHGNQDAMDDVRQHHRRHRVAGRVLRSREHRADHRRRPGGVRDLKGSNQ